MCLLFISSAGAGDVKSKGAYEAKKRSRPLFGTRAPDERFVVPPKFSRKPALFRPHAARGAGPWAFPPPLESCLPPACRSALAADGAPLCVRCCGATPASSSRNTSKTVLYEISRQKSSGKGLGSVERLSPKESLAEFRRRSDGRSQIVFSDDMCVRKNTDQAAQCASASHKRVRGADCKPFSKNGSAIF